MSLMEKDTSIYGVLRKEHARLKELLEKACETTERADVTRTELLARLTKELLPHAKAEEHVLYRRLRKDDETHDISLEAIEEHRVAERLLKELADVDTANEHWLAKMEVLRESVEHRVKEEEGEMFSKAKNVLSEEEADAIGEQFVTEKKKIQSELT